MRLLILLLITYTIPLVSTIEAELSCPKEVSFEEEFICKIDAKSVDNIYDVKIYIKTESSGINRIWDENIFRRADWYLREVIDKDGIYEIKLKIHREYNGVAVGEFKLRNKGGRIVIDEMFEINIIKKTKIIEKQEEKIRSNKLDDKEEYETIIKQNKEKTKELNPIVTSQKVINLNPLNKTESEQIIYKSKNQRIKDYMVYGFIFLLICIIIVLFYEKKW